MTLDVSIVIPAHHEGRLLHPTLRSVYRSIDYATARGVTSEIVVVMDRPNQRTRDYLAAFGHPDLQLFEVNHGDLGMTRNHGVKSARGKYIAFQDGDDLFSENWVHAAATALASSDGDVIVHPEYHLVFDADTMMWKQLSSDDPEANMADMIEANHWSAICAAPRELLLRFPYAETTTGSGFGFEDWHFNCETLAHGVVHRVIPGTVVFMRRKQSGSLLASTHHALRIVRPGRFFAPEVFATMVRGLDADS